MVTVSATVSNRSEIPAQQRFVLPAVDWLTYQKVSDALTGRHVRLTFDGENLEFMTISPAHAKCSRLIGRFVVVLTEEMDAPIGSFGDMTCDREDVQRGLEPDECFYLAHEPLVRGKDRIDLSSDPPPDLAVEVEITRSTRNRMDIYAKLGIPEVWRYDGETLRVHRLGESGQYEQSEHSMCFPLVSAAELASFLRQRSDMDENGLVRVFRIRVRELLAGSV